MKGTVRSKQKCEHCSQGFTWTGQGRLLCPCGRPAQAGIYVEIHHDGQQTKIYSDAQGQAFESARHAERTLEKIRGAIDDRTFDARDYRRRDQKELLFKNYAEAWLKIRRGKSAAGELSPETIQTEESYTRTRLIPLFGGMDIREIKTRHLELKMLELDQALSANTRRTIMEIMAKILRDAEKWEDIVRAPRVPRPKAAPTKKPLPPAADIEAIFQAIPKEHMPVFIFLRMEPMRPGEVCKLTPGDINTGWTDPETGEPIPCVEIREETRKAGTGYRLPLAEPVVDMLATHTPEGPFLFSYRHGGILRPYTTRKLDQVWRIARKRAGIEQPWTIYQACRHTIATNAVNRGADIGAVQAALGHASPTTTARYYVRYRPGTLQSVIQMPQNKTRPKPAPEKKRASRSRI